MLLIPHVRRSVLIAVTAGTAMIGCATIIGLPEENGDQPPKGVASDSGTEGDVSVQDGAPDAIDSSQQGDGEAPSDSGPEGDAANDSDPEVDAPLDSEPEADAPTDAPAPVGEILKLTAGVHHACVIRARGDGGTRTDCWGSNGHGELGRGVAGDPLGPGPVTEPTTSNEIRTLVDIAAGEGHTCAIDEQRDVYCWGSNLGGQLGLGNQQNTLRPKKVPTLSQVELLALGNATSMAHDSNGKTWWWGQSLLDPNMAWQPAIFSTSPTEVTTPLGKLSGLSTTSRHACVIKSPSGEVRCWGNNQNLQSSSDESACSECALADGGTNKMVCDKAPALVPGLPGGVLEVRAGWSASCALMSNLEVWCWGDPYTGQLGVRSDSNVDACGAWGKIADQVIDASGYSTIVMGFEHVCGLKQDRTVVCWGADNYGTLGNGDAGPSLSPVPVLKAGSQAPLDGIDFLATQGGSTCAARRTGEVFCWGENYGEFAWMMDGSEDNLSEATQIVLPPVD